MPIENSHCLLDCVRLKSGFLIPKISRLRDIAEGSYTMELDESQTREIRGTSYTSELNDFKICLFIPES